MKKAKRTLKKIGLFLTNSICIVTFLLIIMASTFFITNINDTNFNLSDRKIVNQTKIYDRYNHEIEHIGKEDDYVEYNQIPQVLIDALLSIEDNEFYYHDGFNIKRIITSLIHNISSSSTQGGSTLTQQLIKNTTLTNEKTYTRKVKEAYLSYVLENNFTKEEILELYFNKVYFEQSVPGINYASKVFFNKSVSQINLVEASVLAGLVKSPSYYYPFSFPERTDARKNIVLKSMLDNKAISQNQYNLATSINIKDILYQKESKDNLTYPFQAYLDLVYEEVKILTGKDLYTHPLIVETYLDSSLQNHIDQIQEGKIINFTDDNQQIGGVVIENNGTNIIGVVGGRNYNGKKVFNRGFHLKRNPASTIKPLLSYPLALEYLSYHPLTTIEDKEYYYLGSQTLVHNADKKYLGNLSLIEAIGYSRNTCAVETFDKVVNKIGANKVKDYLESINLMDQGVLTSSYALGGMTYGISPLQLGGGYALLANHGRYQKPTTIKKIMDYEGNILYQKKDNYQQVISEESADQITYSLHQVIERNYLNIGVAKPKNSFIAGKTGTNAYDAVTIKNLKYPSNADKDIWFAGYSKDYTCVIWTGFDEALEKKNYFSGSDSRKKISKLVFKSIMEQIDKNNKFSYSNKLKEVAIVKGLNDTYFPNEIIPSNSIDYTLIDPTKINIKTLPNINIEQIDDVDIFYSINNVVFQVKTPLIEDIIYENIFGKKLYQLTITDPDLDKEIIVSEDGFFDYYPIKKGEYLFELTITFSNNNSLFSKPYSYSFINHLL